MLTASDTAYSIAFVRAMEGERPSKERLFEDPFAGLFSAAGAHAAEGTKRFLELAMFVDGVRLRTRFIDDFVREGLASGIRQLVLLGAGFDARGLRMPEIAAYRARVYEVDFAAQLEKKRALLAAANVAVPTWIEYVPCDFGAPDFADALASGLRAGGFETGAGALFVMEGVIAYIDTAALQSTFELVARVGGPGTRLVFDFAAMAFDPDPAAERTRRAGFTRFEECGYDAIWRRYLPADPPTTASVMSMGIASV